MSVEHPLQSSSGEISYRKVALLDRRHPSYASPNKTTPLVIRITPDSHNGKIQVEQGRFPFEHCFRITGASRRLLIVGGDQRRSMTSLVDVHTTNVNTVSAFSDITVITAKDSQTKVVPRNGAQHLVK